MTIFARTKLLMYDNCFKEDPNVISLKYVGPNPAKLYAFAYNMIKTVWRAGDGDIQEENYNWTKGEEEKFSVKWVLHRDLDKFTYYWVKITVSGSGNDKTGKASVDISPVLITEYPQETVWQRSLLYEILRTFWHRMFYHTKRFEYIGECRDLTAFYAKRIKEYFKQLTEEASR